VAIETEVRHQTLQLVVLFPKLTQLAQFAQTQTCILLLSQIKALLADPMLAADFNHCLARLRLPKYPQNLRFAMTLLRKRTLFPF
jgi:hypothetical protein